MKDNPDSIDRRNPNNIDRRRDLALAGHLELLATMSSHLAVSIDIEVTIQKALDMIVKYVNAEAGSLFLLEENGKQLVCRANVGPVTILGYTLQANEGIVGQCVTTNKPSIVRDVNEEPNFDFSVDLSTGFTTRSILCAPMSVQDYKIGAIELINKKEGKGLFSDHDLMMLQTLTSAAALAVWNSRMAKKLVQQERMFREIELAIEMQRSLLPAPQPHPFPILGFNLPAYEVSGDFYDFFTLENGCIYFSLGDVSGKGMDAALLMSKTASLFRCLGKTILQPSTLLATINRELCETSIHGMFVTMACGILNPKTGEITLANAGHEPPLLHDAAGTFSSIPASVPPLGIIPMDVSGKDIQEKTVSLQGGTLYMFTDGVTEGFLGNGERLKVEGLMEIINAHSKISANKRIDSIVSYLHETGGHRHDDITILIIEDLRSRTGDTGRVFSSDAPS